MKRKEDLPIERHSLNLFKGDFARLQIMAGRAGAGKIIRYLVTNYIAQNDKKVNAKVPLEAVSASLSPDDLKDILA